MLGIERNPRGVNLGEAEAWKEGDRRVEALGPGAEAALTSCALEGTSSPPWGRTPAWGHDTYWRCHLQGGQTARGPGHMQARSMVPLLTAGSWTERDGDQMEMERQSRERNRETNRARQRKTN